jgi:hypothetical protein
MTEDNPFKLKVEGEFHLPSTVDPKELMRQLRGVLVAVLPEETKFEIYMVREVDPPVPPDKPSFMKRIK